jgi:hypothetical protein
VGAADGTDRERRFNVQIDIIVLAFRTTIERLLHSLSLAKVRPAGGVSPRSTNWTCSLSEAQAGNHQTIDAPIL